MSILQTNNNILRESKYTLKIIDGEKAEVYTSFYNFDLNTNNYWSQFLDSADYIEIPIISIDSMTKSQSIWYRNQQTNDSLIITVDSDYNNNIVEFMNKGVKNSNLDFDNIEQLIFILEIKFINSAGYRTTKPIFVGRPEIYKDSTSTLKFSVSNLDKILASSTFEDNVLQANEGSFWNFIDLKQGFERIFNNPHEKDDDYAYPVCPFDINRETYLPASDKTISESYIMDEGYTSYAEDSIIGLDNVDQVFFYRDSPECGIATIEKDEDGNVLNNSTFFMNEARMFINQDDEFTGASDDIKDNMFRTMRPIRTFIADEEKRDLVVAALTDDAKLFTIVNADDEWSLDVGNEIIVLECPIELLLTSPTSNNLDKIIFMENTANVFYYNKTKDIMYWSEVINQAQSVPFPKLWLDLRLPGYFNADLVWNSYLLRRDYEDTTYGRANRRCFVRNENANNDVNIMMNSARTASVYNNGIFEQVQDVGVYGYRLFDEMRKDDLCGIDYNAAAESSRIRLEPDSGTNVEMNYKMDALSKFKPKSIVMTDSRKLVFNYCDYSLHGLVSYRETERYTVCNMDWTDVKDTIGTLKTFTFDHTEYLYDQDTDRPKGRCIEVSKDPYNTSLSLFLQLSQSNYNNLNDYTNKTEIGYHNILTTEQFQIYSDNLYYSGNFNFANFKTYIVKGEDLYAYDSYSLPFVDQFFPTGSRLLDCNYDEDKAIYSIGNDIYYVKVTDTSDIIFQTTLTSTINYLLSMDRIDFGFNNPNENSVYYNNQDVFFKDLRLMGFNGTRYNAATGLANSFFKNMYNDNLGIKQIGFDQYTNSIILDDSVISSIDVKTYTYNKLEYEKYDIVKNEFTSIDNDDSNDKTEDDDEYDEALNINMYSNIDLNLDVSIFRGSVGVEVTCNNSFITNLVVSFTPSSYSSFTIDLSGVPDANGNYLNDVVIYVNFYDGELEINKTFRGSIDRRVLKTSGVKDEVVSTNNKLIWQNSKTLGLKFPFLYDIYSSEFNNEMSNYWIDTNLNIRKMLVATVVVDELLLFKENYSILNIGEQRIVIDSNSKYLNGYGFYNNNVIPYGDNRASFYIEKAAYNFKTKQTTLTLVSI